MVGELADGKELRVFADYGVDRAAARGESAVRSFTRMLSANVTSVEGRYGESIDFEREGRLKFVVRSGSGACDPPLWVSVAPHSCGIEHPVR
jgi:imidazolonepropionase-like amidohydrolase